LAKLFSAFTLAGSYSATTWYEAENRWGAGKLAEVLMNTYFPDPTVQAMILLDETGNDLPTAMELALMNARKENTGDFRYWVAVADALTVKEQEN
jgi:hypothetical protein